MDYEAARKRFKEAGQGHVFAFWDELNATERKELLSRAREIDLDELGVLVGTVSSGGEVVERISRALEPAPYVPLPADRTRDPAWGAARKRGEETLRAGRVAAFTVAGGQGTRLGFDGPKGTFPVTPVKKKSLFQLFAEKIRAAQRAYGSVIPWLIMTSHANHEATVSFFEENGFFGLERKNVYFFRQGRMPAVDFEGKILLESRSSIAMSPDGHGGALRAMKRSGVLDEIRSLGIDTISYFQVDNPLVQVIDPYFIGFHVKEASDMSSKMIPKAYPEEKVGLFCRHEGNLTVLEYSDLPDELARERDEAGNLRFNAGSIAIHLFSADFVERMGRGDVALPFHRARKKVPFVDFRGERVDPEEANGIKFEMFVFDALPAARNPLIIETDRKEEFSPVKNATGVDSADSSRRDQLLQFARWLQAAGVAVPVDDDGLPSAGIEVSPLFAWDGPSFQEAWKRLENKPEIRDGLYLGGEGEPNP